MKKIIYILTVFTVALMFSACEDFLDVNTDPNAPSEVSLDLRIKPTITMVNGASQWRGTREVSAITQYVASRQTARSVDTWKFSSAYFYWQNSLVWAFPNAVDLIVLGEEQNSPHFTGVGKIFKAFIIMSMSDQYGKMPWDDLYNGKQAAILTPQFIEQKDIYVNGLALLDEAIIDLSSSSNEIGLNQRDGDILYQGDTDRWIKFAYALKARFLNHYSKKSSIYDPAAILAACGKSFDGDGMDAQFNYIAGGGKTQANPFSSDGYGGFSSATSPRYGGFSNFFVEMLKNSPLADDGIDPRISIIMNPSINAGEYKGLVTGRGYDTDLGLDDYSNVPGGFYSKADSPFPFITYAEVKFIEAEASLRSGDAAGAMSAYKEGVLANMRKLEVDVDALNVATDKLDALSTGDFTADGNNAGLSLIMTQKYISNVFNPETWVDMRRMDYSSDIYPGLVRPENVNVVFDDNEWIKAMIYERNEENRNGENVGDNRPEIRLRTSVWWDIAE